MSGSDRLNVELVTIATKKGLVDLLESTIKGIPDTPNAQFRLRLYIRELKAKA